MLVSARFFGDDVLESCLTGHRIFQGSGDPPESIAELQRALADLGFDVDVDGVFGAQTGQAVTAYKTQKGLVPNDPVVGPGTMAALDADFAHELFDAKSAQLADTPYDPGLRTGNRVDISGAVSICQFANGVCVEVGHVDVYALPPAMFAAWTEAGGVDGAFGLPSGDPLALDDLRTAQEFEFVTLVSADTPEESTLRFYPRIDRAAVHLPAARALSSTGADGTVAIGFHQRYLENGLTTDDPKNPGEVFAEPYADLFAAVPSPLKLGFNGDKSAGVANPNMEISGLSRRFGTVSGDIAAFVPPSPSIPPQFDLSRYFPDSATLFGGIKLKDLADFFEPPPLTDSTGDRVPQFQVDTSQAPQIRTVLKWTPDVRNHKGDIPNTLLRLAFGDRQNSGSLSIQSETVTGLPGVEPSAFTSGKLTNFTLSFAPGGTELVSIHFREFSFRADTGKKPDVRIQLAPDAVTLGGDLDFLQTLIDTLRSILGNGPSVRVEGGTITAGYSVAVPNISIGVFSLENIAVSLSVVIPLTGTDPTQFRFSFADKTHHFTLTVELLGGGGFFAIAVTSAGIESIQLAVDAGANVSFDLAGLASGNAHIMLGLNFSYTPASAAVGGYLRAGAELTVLQLISLHVEFFAGLTYIINEHVIYASVTVTVEVVVSVLHTTVPLTLERRFNVPGASSVKKASLVRTFAERVPVEGVMTAEDWAEYAGAFV